MRPLEQAQAKVEEILAGATSLEDVNRHYDFLSKLSVPLDDDPVGNGPTRLNAKIAEVRRSLVKCEDLYGAVSQTLLSLTKEVRVHRTGFDMAVKILLTSDPEVRAGRNLSDRTATATVKLQQEYLHLQNLELRLMAYEALMDVVKARRSDLKDTASRLRDQISLCDAEIRLGRRWNVSDPNKTPDLVPGVQPGPKLDSEKGFDELLAQMDSAIAELGTGPSRFSEELGVLVESPPEAQDTQTESEDSDSLSDIFSQTRAKDSVPALKPSATMEDVDKYLDVLESSVIKPSGATTVDDSVEDILSLLD